MKGSIFAKTLPKDAGARREQMILDAVRRRDIAPIAWVPITTSFKGPSGRNYTAKILVSKDALRIGDATDSFRVNANHRTAQLIADQLDSVLPTPYLGAQIWNQAVLRLPTMKQPRMWWQDGTMAKTYRMLEQSKHVDNLIAEAQAKTGKDGLIADVGKDWVTHHRLWEPYTPTAKCETGHPRAMNYGWHTRSSMHKPSTIPGIRVIQPGGLCHLIAHTDYSQVIRLIRRDVEVCGLGFTGGCMKMDIRQIATSPELYGLVTAARTPLQAMRHPDVPPSCDKRCPEPIPPRPVPPEPSNGASMEMSTPTTPQPTPEPTEPPPEAGPINCQLNCDKLPSVEPDPTYEYLQAEMSVSEKAVMLAAGAVLGYVAVAWLLPKL